MVNRDVRRTSPLLRFAGNVTSQGGEDGIIGHLLGCLAPQPGDCFVVDVGSWDGKHLSNSWSLLNGSARDSWRGLLLEANAERSATAEALYADNPRVSCVSALVDAGGFTGMLAQHGVPHSFAFLSIDVDGADYHLLQALDASSYRPQLICIEFNPSAPNRVSYVQAPAGGEAGEAAVHKGSSLRALRDLAVNMGYTLVVTTTFNALFVRRDRLALIPIQDLPSAAQLVAQSDDGSNSPSLSPLLASLVADSELDALHSESMSTVVLQAYDGELIWGGVLKLLWSEQKRAINPQQLQVLKPSERSFAFAPPLSFSGHTGTDNGADNGSGSGSGSGNEDATAQAEARTSTPEYLSRIADKVDHTLTRTSLDTSSVSVSFESRQEGKVRDVYKCQDCVVIVATDRQSAFDRQLASIPYKGRVLNQTSLWWFHKTAHLVPNHVIATGSGSGSTSAAVHPNITIGRKCAVFPIEFVMRGYLTGSTSTSVWTNYNKGVRLYCGHTLPEGMVKNQQLSGGNLLTPTTKDDLHDELISGAEIVSSGRMTQEDYDICAAYSHALFAYSQQVASERGLILVDTKYEFGKTAEGHILLVDELQTPDSSRYWIAASYAARMAASPPLEPENVDKEFLRRWYAERCDPYKDEVLPAAPRELVCELSRRYAVSCSIVCVFVCAAVLVSLSITHSHSLTHPLLCLCL